MSNSAAQTYLREFLLAMAGYVVVLPVSILAIQAGPEGAWWRVPVALAPVVPAAFVLVAFLRFFRRMDELQRRIQFEGLALAFGATSLLTFSYGFLENVGFPQVSWVFIAPLMIALWGLGCAWAGRSYR
jgi:hypothetical protein